MANHGRRAWLTRMLRRGSVGIYPCCVSPPRTPRCYYRYYHHVIATTTAARRGHHYYTRWQQPLLQNRGLRLRGVCEEQRSAYDSAEAENEADEAGRLIVGRGRSARVPPSSSALLLRLPGYLSGKLSSLFVGDQRSPDFSVSLALPPFTRPDVSSAPISSIEDPGFPTG